MKLSDIQFEDDAFKACVLASGKENAEDIVELRCRKQGIETATGIEYLTNLKLLDLTRNDLGEIDLSNNSSLEEVYLGNNELSSLDISGCSQLVHLEVFINQLGELDVSNNPLLEDIYANKNEIKTIDLSKNTELLDLRLSGNELTELDLSANTKLQRLELEKNPLSDVVKARMEKMQSAQVQL